MKALDKSSANKVWLPIAVALILHVGLVYLLFLLTVPVAKREFLALEAESLRADDEPIADSVVHLASPEGANDGILFEPLPMMESAEEPTFDAMIPVAAQWAGGTSNAGIGSGAGGGAPGRQGQEARNNDSFLTPSPSSRRVLYLLDGSANMDGPRFRRICDEVCQAIELLDRSQLFTILVAGEFRRLRAKTSRYLCLPGTTETSSIIFVYGRSRLMALNIERLRSIEPSGMAHMDAPLRRALAVQPDEIYLLTGGATLEDAATLREAAAATTVVHVTLLASPSTPPPANDPHLLELARLTGGRFQRLE